MEKLKTELPAARGMTNGEYKKFKESGHDPVFFTTEKLENYGKSIVESKEYIIKEIYDGNFSDDVNRGDLMALAEKTMRITNGFEAEIKNS
jgi:hypothetical protein